MATEIKPEEIKAEPTEGDHEVPKPDTKVCISNYLFEAYILQPAEFEEEWSKFPLLNDDLESGNTY